MVRLASVALSLLGLVALGSAAPAAAEDVVEPNVAAADVVVQGLAEANGHLTGMVVNQSSSAVKGIQLRIRFDWRWRDEKHPGKDEPSFGAERTLPGEIPPRGSVPLAYDFPERVTGRTDGDYQVDVDVVGYTKVLAAPK